MSDTPRTDALIYRKNTIEMQRHELLDLALALERELAEAQAEITRLEGEAESWAKVFDRTCEHLADAKEQLRLCNVDQFTTAAELADAQRNYMDLIMSVGKAYPNETRHQTALRYIRECETPSTDQAKCSAITVRENE